MKWARLVTYRGDGWMLTSCQAESLFRCFSELFQDIKKTASIITLRSCASLFETKATATVLNNAIHLLKQHLTSCFKNVGEDLVNEHICNWISFIQDERFCATWSPKTQLGIVSQVRLTSATVISIGKLTRLYVGSRAYSVLIEGIRTSCASEKRKSDEM